MSGNETPAPGFGASIARTFKRILWAVLLVGVAAFLFLYFGSYSTGSRSGMVIKMSKRGVLFKTSEGQLNLQSFGAIDPQGNTLNEVFSFSVERREDSLYHLLEQVALTGERVNLYYVERYMTFPWRGETRYFITGVERGGQQRPSDRGPYGH